MRFILKSILIGLVLFGGYSFAASRPKQAPKKTIALKPAKTRLGKKIVDPATAVSATPTPTPTPSPTSPESAAVDKAEKGKDSLGDLLKEKGKSKESLSAALGGSSSPTTVASGTKSTLYDDNAAKGEKGDAPPPNNNSGGQISGGNGGGKPPPQIQAFDRWFPTCIFLDPSVPNGNNMVKGLVDMAAACQVNLVVFPFYIKNTPGSADAINQQARQSCNAINGLQNMGVNRVASATVVPRPDLAAQMCGASNNDRDTCEELTFNPGDTIRQRAKMTGRGGNWNPTGSGIVGRNNPQALATTIFRQITGLPYGSGAGLSLGDWNEGDAGAVGLQKTDGLSPLGCRELQKSSYPNTDKKWKYNPEQETYVVKGEAGRMFDLGKPIFQNPAGPPSGGKAADSGGGSGGGGSGDGGGANAGSGSAPASSSASLTTASGGGGHKRPLGGFGTGVGGSSGGGTGPVNNGASGAKTISGGYGSGSGGEADGSSSGGQSGADSNDVVTVGGARSVASEGGPGGESTTYDDKAKKYETGFGGNASAAGAPGQAVGVLKGGSLDPNALKKSSDEYSEALEAAKAKRPRVIAGGAPDTGTILSLEYLKKIGKTQKRQNSYKGKVTNGEVTSMRRGNP